MYITINDIKGEKRIDLPYSIDSDKEITVIIMLSHNIQYKVLKLRSGMDSDSKKLIPSGTYASRGLLSKPQTPQYKALKNKEFTSLNLEKLIKIITS